MKITRTNIKIKDLINGYIDKGDDGVFAYGGKLTVRPSYQREFIYKDKQRDEVVNTVMKGFPLNVIYWSKTGEDSYEVLDGQQRTISICQFYNKDYSINHRFFHNFTDEEKDQFLNYELDVYICEGTEAEKLEWFKIINIAGEVLTNQELLNASYTGAWLSDAKKYFSKRNCPALLMGDGYIKGNPIRQDILEKVLEWIADRDNLGEGVDYMAAHSKDSDANALWIYYQTVINWAKTLFPNERKGITNAQDWGILYNKYHANTYNSDTLNKEIKTLLLDDDVTNKKGVIPYVLSGKTPADQRHLSLRTFSEAQKIRAYEKQNGRCAICGQPFDMHEMQGDHILPWSKGGRTVDENLQLLCSACNGNKSDK